ncbi:MAG: hypothetical protein ACTSW4_03645 [Candidatus Ranarchaeia archaeon]
MRTTILIIICSLLVIPCKAETITVGVSEPVSLTIEADDFNDGNDISTIFDDVTLSQNGTGPVYAVNSTKTYNGNLGTKVIGNSDGETWGLFRGDFNGLARQVAVDATLAWDEIYNPTTTYIKAYDSEGTLLESNSEQVYTDTAILQISRDDFDIAYFTVSSSSRQICLDRVVLYFRPVCQGVDFERIQDAIDYSWDGDTIIVNQGNYYENINFNGRAITLMGQGGSRIDPVSGDSVTFNFGEDSNSVLSGFVIGEPIRCFSSSPTINGNYLLSSIYGYDEASPIISNNQIHSSAKIYGCNGKIIKNSISGSIYRCDGLIANNLITGDGSDYGLEECAGTIINNTIVGKNRAVFKCGNVRNNIIAFNKYGIMYPCNNSYNNIWANQIANFSDGAAAGIGDICVDPLFASESNYHLKSGAGRWAGISSWVIDDANSRCIDAGDTSDSVGLEPNPNGARINMGAYGGTAEASKSPSGIIEPVCTEYPAMDFNKDCKVDFEDFAVFTQSWLECNLDPPEACWD